MVVVNEIRSKAGRRVRWCVSYRLDSDFYDDSHNCIPLLLTSSVRLRFARFCNVQFDLFVLHAHFPCGCKARKTCLALYHSHMLVPLVLPPFWYLCCEPTQRL